MARPPLPLGHHGSVKVTREDGRWVARCRVRDLDGVTRRVERWGSSRTAAQRALQDELRQRRGERTEVLRPDSRFRDAAALWATKIAERREDSTTDTYRHWLERLVLPELGELRLHECDVARLDAFFARLANARRTIHHEDGTTTEKVRYAANSRRTVRTIVSGVLQQAVLHNALGTNPVRELERIESPKGHRKAPPRGLTAEERRRLLAFVDSDPVAIGADLPDLIRFAIGSGLRVGELCAVRWMDLNLDGIPVVTEDDMRLVPIAAVTGNLVYVRGKGLVRHYGKTPTALRIVPLPELVTTRLRARRRGDEDPEWPVFPAAGQNGPTYHPAFRQH